MDENHWFTESCARAFWDQKEGLPYKRLVADTMGWAAPKPGERWIDLGCGSGALSAALWQASAGGLAQLLCLDCAAINADPIGKLSQKFAPGRAEVFRFIRGDFSTGLADLPDASLDGAISGLAISYAQSRDPVTGQYTDAAFRHLLADVRRVLKPAGRFVFSINVPDPNFWRILWASFGRGLRISKPARQLTSALKMQYYGAWLKREARRGRFHYPSADRLRVYLQDAGFEHVEQTTSYAGQAFVVRARPLSSAADRRQSA
jgi:ubiquinone/menaquinone biosynthesis C-methylase UbiE